MAMKVKGAVGNVLGFRSPIVPLFIILCLYL